MYRRTSSLAILLVALTTSCGPSPGADDSTTTTGGDTTGGDSTGGDGDSDTTTTTGNGDGDGDGETTTTGNGDGDGDGDECPPVDVPRSVWAWDQGIATDPSAALEFFDFAATKGITGVYLESEALINNEPASLATFVEQAHDNCIAVSLLFGYAPWALTENHGDALNLATASVAFAASMGATGPVAVHFDVEPYSLPEWTADSDQTASQYLTMLELIAASLDGSELALEVDIPFWFDTRTTTHTGVERLVSELVLERVDRVAIMDYRDYASPPDGIIDNAQSEVDYAATLGKQVIIGVETVCGLDPEKVSFCEEGEAAMETELALTAAHYEGAAAWVGFAIHEYASYLTLAP